MKNLTLDIKFEINFATLLAFITGILAGFILLGLVYLIGCLSSLRIKKIKLNKALEQINEDDIKLLIKKYQNSFSIEKKKRKTIPFDYFYKSIYELIKEIAGQFYPKSKNPICELSLNEIIMLDQYIVKKIDDLLSKKGLNLFRNLKLSTIMLLVNKKNEIDNSKLIKNAKKYKVKKIYSIALTALNVINPYHWFKKLVVNPSINLLLNKIFILCYTIIGEETYNVYSKQAFINDDEELKELLTSIEQERIKLNNEGLLVENKVTEEIVKPRKKQKKN